MNGSVTSAKETIRSYPLNPAVRSLDFAREELADAGLGDHRRNVPAHAAGSSHHFLSDTGVDNEERYVVRLVQPPHERLRDVRAQP